MKDLSITNSNQIIKFYYPLPKFPSVSVTGDLCMLNCKHCMGHYLKHMPNVDTPEKLKDYAMKLDASGGKGMLISGGCTSQGKIPLDDFFSTFSWIKDNTSLLLNLHTGLLDESDAKKIADSGVDFLSLDIVGSEETISRVYGLNYYLSQYKRSLLSLIDAGFNKIVPHICIGLDYGNLKGEYDAIKIANTINPEVIVLISLIPTKNTPMENIPQPKNDDILKIIKFTKQLNPKIELAIGCMRAKLSKIQFEKQALDSGITRMALPSKSIVDYAISRGYEVMFFDGCCATPIKLEDKLRRIS